MSARLQNTRQRISSDWKTLENQPTNLHTHSAWPWMNSLKAFFFLQEEGFKVWTALSLFTVNALRFFANFLLLICLCPHVRIRPIVRHIRNAYQKCLSEKLTYFIATLLDIRTSFCALTRRQTVTMVYAIHGPAATQATIFYTVWKSGFAIVFVSIMQYCFTCLIVVEKQLLASH